jgi:glycerophosphoryl diester phosphodiesterase
LKPLVFGHRGASGYRPENTIEAFELAISQGSDGVECDLVPTKDGELIIRHENWLNGTTNVASLSQFEGKQSTGYSDGLTETGWFSEDYNFAELSELRAIERVPDTRPGSAKFDGQFLIPTIDDLLAAEFMNGKTLVIEIKHGMHFMKNGINMADILARKLDDSDWKERKIDVVIETFDEQMLEHLKAACGPDKKYVFLTELDRLPKGATRMSREYLESLASRFDGISVDLALALDLDAAGNHTIDNGLIDEAKAAGLSIYGWTLRAEDATASVDEYFGKVAESGLQGLFVDQPDLLRQIVDGLA